MSIGMMCDDSASWHERMPYSTVEFGHDATSAINQSSLESVLYMQETPRVLVLL